MEKDSKIVVFGARGMVGSALVRCLRSQGYRNILESIKDTEDLTLQSVVNDYFIRNFPEYVFLAAAKVGGIRSNNTHPAEFIYNNLQIQINVIKASQQFYVKKLLFLGSACIYPKVYTHPISEEDLLCGPLEPTNNAYAVAKIAGITMCQAFRKQCGCNYVSVMPTNLYGRGDRYFPEGDVHVIPDLIRKFHFAKVNNLNTVEIWGNGSAYREFLYVDDCADACVEIMEKYDVGDIINIGCGSDISIDQLALCIKRVVGYDGTIIFNDDELSGVDRRLLNSDKITNLLNWRPKISLIDGLKLAYQDFLERFGSLKS